MSSDLTRWLAPLTFALLLSACSDDSIGAGPVPWPPAGPGAPAALAAELTTRNFYVVLDASGSMNERACQGGGSKIEQARAALQAFVKAVPRNANLGLMVFDQTGISERVALGGDNRDEFMRRVLAIHPSGGTPLRGAVEIGRRQLEAQARRQLGYGEYNLVIVTDGEASKGHDPRDAVDALIAQTPIVLHTVGFCIDARHSLNQAGRTIYKQANDTAELQRGLESVLAESPSFTVQRFKDKR